MIRKTQIKKWINSTGESKFQDKRWNPNFHYMVNPIRCFKQLFQKLIIISHRPNCRLQWLSTWLETRWRMWMEGVGGRGGGSVWGGEAKSSQTLKWSSRQRRCWVKQSLLTRVRMDGHVCENIFQQGTTWSFPTSRANIILTNWKLFFNMSLKQTWTEWIFDL